MAILNDELLEELDMFASSCSSDPFKTLVTEKYILLCKDILSQNVSSDGSIYDIKKGTFFMLDTADTIEIFFFTDLFGEINTSLVELGILSFKSPMWSKVMNLKIGDKFDENKEILYKTTSRNPHTQHAPKSQMKIKKRTRKKEYDENYCRYPIGHDSSGMMQFRTKMRNYVNSPSGRALVRIKLE